MKTLLVIQGGQAVGKMTVGEEIEKITDLKLFHNHMTVEIANHFYGFGESFNEEEKIIYKALFSDLRDRMRLVVFDNIAKSYLPGLIFTGAMYYDNEIVWNLIELYFKTFRESAKSIGEEAKIFIVELNCSIEERYKRNISEHRLNKKPSKQNLEWSKQDIERQILTKRITANEDDIKRFNADGFLKINNTNLSAQDTALQIVEHFSLKRKAQ